LDIGGFINFFISSDFQTKQQEKLVKIFARCEAQDLIVILRRISASHRSRPRVITTLTAAPEDSGIEKIMLPVMLFLE
jgi:hypothetical protein